MNALAASMSGLSEAACVMPDDSVDLTGFSKAVLLNGREVVATNLKDASDRRTAFEQVLKNPSPGDDLVWATSLRDDAARAETRYAERLKAYDAEIARRVRAGIW